MSPSKVLAVPIAAAGVEGDPCLLKRLLMAAGRKDDEDDGVLEDEKVRLVLLLMLSVLEDGVAERSVLYVCVWWRV